MKLIESIKNWFKKNKKLLIFVLSSFIIWQLVIAVVIFLGERYFPTTGSYLYSEISPIHPHWLWSRANFDGMHYLGISRSGYDLHQQAFFPLYPQLINFLKPLFNSKDLFSALFISSFSFLASMVFLYKLVRLDLSKSIAKRTLVYLLIFPTAFYFTMVYTESLFLMFILGSFYFARTRRFWLAGILGALGAMTRLPGIFLFPALGVEWWFYQKDLKDKKKAISSLIPLFLIPLGLLYYIRFLSIRFGDPLMFIHVQPYFGAGRSGGKIILLYQVFWRYFKMLVTVDKFTTTYFVVVLEFLSTLGFLALAVFTFLRRWYAYAVFMALALIAPSLTGTLSSIPRYVLVLFPGFIILAIYAEKYRWLRILYPIIAIPLFIFCLILFTRGYWVS